MRGLRGIMRRHRGAVAIIVLVWLPTPVCVLLGSHVHGSDALGASDAHLDSKYT